MSLSTDMFRLILFALLLIIVTGSRNEPQIRIVDLDEGSVQGQMYWDGDFFEFYGVPYATAPTGRDRFKPPLPVKPRTELLDASNSKIICQQTFYTGEEEEEIFMTGEEDCLILNLLVPEVASEENLLPVVVYTHSGAFAGGSSTMGKLNFVARHDVIAVTFNYRVGAIGFACLHTEDIPGNAALKDQLAALKWINKNIKKFGGDPNRVTLAGFSVGAVMAELMALSKHTEGLFDKLILESGSALTPFAINRHPVTTAKNIAISMGYNDTGNIKDLNELYLNASAINLADKSLHFFLTNSTFGYAPCIEEAKNNPEPFLTESPLEVLKRKEVRQYAILTGFANMEGLSRTSKFNEWTDIMNSNFSEFIPADLVFKTADEKNEIAKDIQQFYFHGEEVTHDNFKAYINYFSDSMFKYAILKSANLHAGVTSRPIYFYEFSYVGKLSMQHIFMDKLKGASHRDQTAYIIDFFGYTKSLKDLDTRDRMTWMWTDFIKYENPTAFESPLIRIKWRKYNKKPYYLAIGDRLEMKKNIFEDTNNNSFDFWDKIYNKYYWDPVKGP